MRHHHHRPPPAAKDTIPQRAVRASLHRHVFAIATAVAVFVFPTGRHRHRHRGRLRVGGVKPAQLLPVGARIGHLPRATSPSVVAVAGGALAAVLFPACVEALPVRRGECRSRPRTPRRGTGPLRQRRRCGRRDASVSSPAAGVRPSFASQATAAGLGWHRRAKMERGERSCGCVVCTFHLVCVLVIKNDDSTVSVTNTGCIRCDNRCRVKIVRVDF